MLVGMTDQDGEATTATEPTIEHFLSALRMEWRDGKECPTDKRRTKAPRGRRRPDPFVAVAAMLREWFEVEPWRRSPEFFERLREDRAGVFPDGQLRTVLRRLKK
jgi:hypothetical protein